MNLDSKLEQHIQPVDLRYLIKKIWLRRSWVVVSIVLSTILFAIAAWMIVPTYRASVVVVPTNAESNVGALASTLQQFGGLAALAGIGVGSGDTATEEALAVIRSRQFIEHFISDESLLPIIFNGRWNDKAKEWKGSLESRPTLAAGVRFFNKKILKIAQDKKTGLVTLNVEWTDPERAAAWANTLIARLNDEMRARALLESESSLEYLAKESRSTPTIETQAAIDRLVEAQVRKRMIANVTHEYVFRVIDKALAPEKNETIIPKILLLLAGPLVGLMIGLVLAIFDEAILGSTTENQERSIK